MQRFTFVSVALVAFLSTLKAAPTNPQTLPALLQLPQIPAPALPALTPTANLDLNNLDDHARAQSRAILDEVVSRYPTLIDSFASLLNTQSLLSPPYPLQNLRVPDLTQSSSLLPLPELPKLNDILPSLPALPSLPGLPGFQGVRTSGEATSPLSTAVDVVLSNLRGFASAPLQFSPIRLAPPGGTPIVQAPGVSPVTRGIQLPKTMVPVILTFPNEEGLSADELAESIKRKIREQAVTPHDGPLNAVLSLDPLALTRVLDVQPVSPTKENFKENSIKPTRRVVPGNILNGNTEVQIYWDNPDSKTGPAEKQSDNVRIGMTDIESNLVPTTYPSRKR